MQTDLQQAKRAVVPPGAGDAVPPVTVDGSVWALVAANVIAIAVAYHQRWPVRELMLLYWAQSLAIGVSYVVRILSLEKFSTEGLKIGGQPVDPTPATRRQIAGFFAMHYGLFHLGYLLFLLFGTARAAPLAPGGWFWLCLAVFAANHAWSLRYNREMDRRGTPNIGTLMITPYLRVVPMHIMILTGLTLWGGAAALIIFGILKTLADVGMHIVAHQRLRKAAPADVP